MKKMALIAALATAALAAAQLTWQSIPLADGAASPDSLRSFLMTDPATGDVFYSKWNAGDYNVHKLGYADAINPGTPSTAWTTFAQPLDPNGGPLYTGNDDSGTGFNIYDGYLYAGTSHRYRDIAGNPFQRQFVRMDVNTGTFSTNYREGDGANFAGFAYNGPNGLRITAKWTGWRPVVDYDVTTQTGADFDYAEVDGKSFDAPGYWGSDSVVGSDGYAYLVEPGVNGTPYQFRRGSLAGTDVSAELATPWVDVPGFPINNDHNRRTNTAIEFIPAAYSISGADELLLMPMNNDGVQTDKLYRFAAADGSALGEIDLPMVLENNQGHGYDLAYANGTIFVLEGKGRDLLWSAAVPEPASLLLIGLAGMLIRRR